MGPEKKAMLITLFATAPFARRNAYFPVGLYGLFLTCGEK
jgi:hypothetical protein